MHPESSHLLDCVGDIDRGVVVGARVVGAKGFAALGLLALAVVTLDFVGVVDRSISIQATDGVAVQMLLLSSGGIEIDRGQAKFKIVPLSSTPYYKSVN